MKQQISLTDSDIISKIMADTIILNACYIDTPLGQMIALADERSLYFLDFADRADINKKIERLKKRAHALIRTEENEILRFIAHELHLYFAGDLALFKTPLYLWGSSFQQKAWRALESIGYGDTASYSQQAHLIAMNSAWRAVANANGANPMAIVLPCHRVINSNGKLGGYGGGIMRKEWLLEHEKKTQNVNSSNIEF
jgi:AraC family transcriptional regulator of adaptative response/methylated-DNA-[protein]-cysteine methyltransferase